jgi:peroxiredoxin Q/BCP
MKPGDSLPNLAVPASDGRTARLREFIGAPLVLYFYPKDATPGCTTEALDFAALHEAFAATGARVIGVSRDSVDSHQRFRDKQSLPFELLSDADETLCQAFDVIHEKNMYGRKVIGIQRSTFLFDAKGRLVREWRGVKVAGHAQAVLDAVEALA